MYKLLSGMALGLVLLTTSVWAAPTAATPTDSLLTERATAALQRAIDHYRAGKLNEAAGLLRGFVVSQADSPLVHSAHLQLARIHADLGEPDLALEYLTKIPPTAWTPAAQLLQGDLMVRSGQTITGIQTLLNMDPGGLTLNERQQRWLILSDATLQLGYKQRALFFLYQALLVEGTESRDEVLARCRILFDNQFNLADLHEAVFMYEGTPLAYLAMLKLGWLSLEMGQKEQAKEWATSVLMGPPGFIYRDEALTLQAQLLDPAQVQRAIGVLLPLSGRYSAFGTLVQRGMQLAQETFRPAFPVRFIYRDSGGDAQQAAQQVAELAIGERVLGLAGPLVGEAAAAAAERANRERVPMLTLSQKEGLAASSLYVFRNSLTTQLQVRELIAHAMQDMGMNQFAMLTPQTRQGELFAELFQFEVERRGGTLVVAESYTPEQTDFRREVKLLLGLDPNLPDDEEDEPPASDVEPQGEEPPPFQALFVPDYADRISLIVPQLEFYGLKGVQLLGTNGWNDPNLLKTAGQFLEGAIFTDGFFRHSPYPFVQEFVERYYNAYGQDPTILEAQGYDAAGILLNLFSRYDLRSREDLRRALTQLQNYPGVTGATRFDAFGEAEKVLFLLQVQNGTIVQIN